MTELLDQLAADPWGRLVLHHLVTGGMWSCYVFLLVVARLTGVFVVAPYGLMSVIPLSVRVGLVVLLSLIIAPTLTITSQFEGQVSPIAHDSLPVDLIPETVADLACSVANEIGLGALLGMGVITVLSGLRLGGEWIDRHSGLGLGTVFNPEWSVGESACGSLIQLSGIAAFLLMEPLGGQWLVLRSLTQSFHAIPVGSASWSNSSIGLLGGVVQQSLVLGLRVAMPLVVTMMLIDMTLAFANRGAPLSLNSFSVALRAGVGLIVLVLTLTAIPESVATTMMTALQWPGVERR